MSDEEIEDEAIAHAEELASKGDGGYWNCLNRHKRSYIIGRLKSLDEITALKAENEKLKKQSFKCTECAEGYVTAVGSVELDRLEAENERLRAALEFRLKHGCNDTCSKQLSAEYHCTCGQEHALKALHPKESSE